MTPDGGRRLRLALAGLWLADAALQFQPFMFTKGFGQLLAASAQGNPPAVAGPVTWSAGIIEHHPIANAGFAVIQLLIAAGIAWRPSVKVALAVSVAWSVAVWWLGEGLGGVLSGSASPWSGAPGAVILYALLAVLLWPASRDTPATFAAARVAGRLPARLLWLALWAGMAYFAVRAASTAPQGMHDMFASMASGEPGWIAAVDHGTATLAVRHGQQASALLAVVCEVIALAIFLPPPAARIAVIFAIAAAMLIWVIGENFGAIFTGTATDPSTGPLLALLAITYWPRTSTAIATVTGQLGDAGSDRVEVPVAS